MTPAPWPEHHLGAIRSAIRAGALRESCLRDLAAILRRPIRDIEAKVAELGGVAKAAKKPPRWKAPISWRRMSANDGEPFMVELAMVTVSEANQREHWIVKACRKAWQREGVLRELGKVASRRVTLALPMTVTLTRIGAKRLDADNLAGSHKGVQDALAEFLGFDDGDERVTWVYKQERGEPGVRIEIERT